MTIEEFTAAYHPHADDTVVACHCGSCDCPGWKIITSFDRQVADALDRLPEVLSKAAYEIGHKFAMEMEMACLKALKGK